MTMRDSSMMSNFYFTFGSSVHFPYQNGHVVVKATDLTEAIEIFRQRFPDKNPDTVNCSFWYPEEIWKKTNMYDHSQCFEIIEVSSVMKGLPVPIEEEER